jgi:hypothetical protein
VCHQELLQRSREQGASVAARNNAAGRSWRILGRINGEPIGGWEAEAQAQHDNALIAQRGAAWSSLRRKFIAKLRCGEVTATGIKKPLTLTSKPIRIKPELWLCLTPNFTCSSAAGSGLELLNIRVFPNQSGSAAKSNKKLGPMAEIRAWYSEYVSELMQRGKTSNREQDLEAARDKFGVARITNALVFDLRRELAPKDWQKRGRRKTPRKIG